MTFADIPAAAAVFVDANTFVYHFVSEPHYGANCTSLLERLERQETQGWTSAHVLAEISHRLMTIEACARFGWPYQGVAARLRRHSQAIAQLQSAEQGLAEIARLGLRIVTIDDQQVTAAAKLCRQYNLLTNDALLVAVLQSHQLTHLASNDADFDRVPGLVRYAPL